jgi:murein L,D-transpeptidase YcbB/YkuD
MALAHSQTGRTALLGSLLALSLLGNVWAQSDPVAENIRQRVEQIRYFGAYYVGDAWVASTTILPELYERRNFRPAWTNPRASDDLLAFIRDIEADGLLPFDYHFDQLERLQISVAESAAPDPGLVADRDLLLTDSLIRLAYHLTFGKVDPEALDANWNMAKEIDGVEPVAFVQSLIDSGSLATELEGLTPQHPFYRRLKTALAAYREIEAQGGWEPVPPGPTLKPGLRDERVVLLRRRLGATGNLGEQSSDPALFDGTLERAVKRFQERHFLSVDGAVGKETLAALNVPVDARIDQIRINLERARWVLQEIEGTFVLVDIAGFRVGYVEEGKVTWESRVQVGKPYRKTPVFKSAIKYVVINPTWTIPPGILAKDVLPKVKKDPRYLKERNIRVIDRGGKAVDPNPLDWSQYTARNFPYQLRQDPGPDNALGRIKIIFPNNHLVYLHDTPSKALFERSTRTFSSGCIRVEKPFELGTLLLADPQTWSTEKIMQIVDSRETETVYLPQPVPVLLLYWTVAVDESGDAGFKQDVYKRDPPVLAALNGEFKFRQRSLEGRDSP